MASKYKERPDGRFMTFVNIGIDANGKPIRKALYASSSRKLEDKVAELRRQVATGIVVSDEKLLVSEWAWEWFKTYKSGLEHNSQLIYKVAISAHIVPFLGAMKLKDIRPHHIQRMINDMVASGLTRAVEKTSQTVKQMFKKAVENNLLIKSPAEIIELPPKGKSKKRALTKIEKSYIMSADLDGKCVAFLLTLLYSGLRKGEALALMKNDIDLKGKTITVNKSLITIGNRPQIKSSPKTNAGNRTIPIPDILVDCLKEYLSTNESIYVFPSASGELMSHNAFRCFWDKIFKRLNKAAGGTDKLTVISNDITAHIFRHTYATMLYYAGVDIKTAQYLLGHSSIQVTMEIYTHLDDGKIKAASSKLNEFISSSQNVVSEAK